ncbi:hypothetical protein C0992_005400 [Termitomyces sp. T32_za158]|nr:hypothetical protein C0992_005400 [Termitomyces sp. T32_za158]
MSLSLKIPDETRIHQLLSKGAVQNDYDNGVTLTDVSFLKKTENNHFIFKAKSSGKYVIVKFTYEDDDELAIPRLQHESQIYVDYLRPLWGVHVPIFYGFYLNDTMDLVLRLHSPDIGLEHDALNASHVLDFEGKPFLVDFGGAVPHECLAWEEAGQLTRETLAAEEGEVLGPLARVLCHELWIFLESTKYCLPSMSIFKIRAFV